MASAKRLYETTFIVNASLDDPQIDTVDRARPGHRSPATGAPFSRSTSGAGSGSPTTINKKTNGFYVNIEFEAPATALRPLERAYQLDELILRHLTIVLDQKAIAARKAIQASAAQAAPDPATPAARGPGRSGARTAVHGTG